MAVDVHPGETFDWGEERALFSMNEFNGAWPHPIDLARGGERFVTIRPTASADSSPQLIVWRNFAQVLEERVPD